MDVNLDSQLEEQIRRKVERGLYSDANAVVRAALDLQDERDRLEELRALIAVGREQYERGDVVEWTPDFMERLMREAKEAERLGVPIPDHVMP